jgi:hypothetical protein
MVEAAQRGEGGLGLSIESAGAIEITVEGRWSTDVLRFEGDFVRQAIETADLGGFDLQNHTDQAKVFCFDLEDTHEMIYTGGGRDLKEGGGTFSEIFTASFLNDGAELAAVVNAALDEKYGLGETEDMAFVGGDDQSVVIEVTTHHWRADDGMTAKTMILCGTEVEALIAAYGAQFPTGLDTGDGKSRIARYDTDAQLSGEVWFGGGKNAVAFDAAESITLGTVVGNGLTQKEDNPNRAWQDDIDEFVYNTLRFDGDRDVSVIAGGEAGDDYLVAEFDTPGGTDTLILEGARVGLAIDEFAMTGGEFDFFA